MLKERRLAAETVAEQLFAAEAAIDAAIQAVALLTATMPKARLDANLAPMVGHEALLQASRTCASLMDARSGICATHEALAVAQRQIGLGAIGFGSLGKGRDVHQPAIHAVKTDEDTVVQAA
ncbi:MAG: hypothetical protein ACMVO5_03700 [Polymorphobacter sp.]|uniref:hypothetical protein n=1 Tax=Polymorphobacter sp. TaxID=1909290 RepID=UPI003A85E82D